MIPSKQLTPDERAELASLQGYLHRHAKSDFANMGENHVTSVIAKASPRVREGLNTEFLTLEHKAEIGCRTKLFDEPKDLRATLDKTTKTLFDKVQTERCIDGLHDRLGTADAQDRLNDEPPSMREHIEAAFDMASEPIPHSGNYTPAGEQQ